MAQVQVIQRQEDPSAKLALQTSQNISENIKRKQAMQLAIMDYKAKVKATDNEAEKMTLDRNTKVLDGFAKIAESDATPAMKMKASHNLAKSFGMNDDEFFTLMGDVGNKAHEYENLDKESEHPLLQGSGDRQLKGAQTSKALAEAGTQNRVNTMIDNQTRAGAVGGEAQGGGMVLSGMSGTNPQFTNLEARQQEIMSEERAKSVVRAEPFMKQYHVMKNQFYQGLEELGPISKAPGQAKLDGFINGIRAEYGDKSMPAVQAVNRALDGISLTVANIANGGGRATSDQDRKAIRETLPDYTMPRATQERLFQYIEAGFPTLSSYSQLPDKDRSKQLQSFMKQAVSTVVENDRARAKRLKEAYPNLSEERLNAALKAIHEKEGSF